MSVGILTLVALVAVAVAVGRYTTLRAATVVLLGIVGFGVWALWYALYAAPW